MKKRQKSNVNLSMIKNITTIEQLSKYYDNIRDYTYLIDRENKQDMDDVIQDTFIKIMDIFDKKPGKVINGGYVALTLRSVYINKLKLKSRYDRFSNVENIIDDNDQFNKYDWDKYDWDKYDKIIENLSWYEKKVYEYCITMNISELSRQSGISQKSLRLTFIKIKNKIKSEMETDEEN